jgi:SAM-dependent MidA family methyltransferase
VTAAGEILRDEIVRSGPMPFSRFMEVALYHAGTGYYRRGRDPFGRAGDYYTAEQLQPVFGMLIAERMRTLGVETVVELGSGRGEMAEAFAEWRYIPVEAGSGAMPERVRGAVFSNEFFDALPVEVAVLSGDGPRELRVGWDGSRFSWIECDLAGAEIAEYIGRYLPVLPAGSRVEVGLEALRWVDRIADALDEGFVFTIDYGYGRREAARFPHGTLMSYRRHTALEDVLTDPGEQDITAHVNFCALQDRGEARGLETIEFGTLAQALLGVGEQAFARAIDVPDAVEATRRRLQLKTLLVGMGETFRVWIARKPAVPARHRTTRV